MNPIIESVFAEDPPGVVLGESEVATLSGEEPHRAARLLEEERYLGAARPVGRTLVQAVHYQEQWVALLVWSPAALKLADRDHDLGWTDSQRAERIGLIVQNRRFLVLAKTRMPNLASRALALAVNALPAAWQKVHGYRPLLAEPSGTINSPERTLVVREKTVRKTAKKRGRIRCPTSWTVAAARSGASLRAAHPGPLGRL